jgi:hypothetical protein
MVSKEGETVMDCCAGSGGTTVALLLNHRNVIAVENDENQVTNLYWRLKRDFPAMVAGMLVPREFPASAFLIHADDAAMLEKMEKGEEGVDIKEEDIRYIPAPWLLENAEPEWKAAEPFPLQVQGELVKEYEKAAKTAWLNFAPIRVRLCQMYVFVAEMCLHKNIFVQMVFRKNFGTSHGTTT